MFDSFGRKMKITDFLEAINKFGEENIEFRIINKDGEIKKLEPFITDNHIIYPLKDENNSDTNTIVLGLRVVDA